MMEKPAATPTSFSMARFPITRQQSKRMTKRVNQGDRGLVKLDFSHLPLYGLAQFVKSSWNRGDAWRGFDNIWKIRDRKDCTGQGIAAGLQGDSFPLTGEV